MVGSGPAGFYAADCLLSADAQVDLLERLPTPWGLVRLGVAPDHPELKTASRVFEKTAAKSGFRFFGNVEVGRDVTHAELTRLYDAVVYTVGAQTDRRLGIPGEDLSGSWAATEFVAWYNGHPDYQHLEFDLSNERAVVIGNGNVAIDVARLLARTEDELAPTDVTEQLGRSDRRLGDRRDRDARPPRSSAGGVHAARAEGARRARRRRCDRRSCRTRARSGERGGARGRTAARKAQRRHPARVRRARARRKAEAARAALLRLPGADLGRGEGRGDRGRRNEFACLGEDGTIRAVPTDKIEVIPCGIVLRSVGYRGVASTRRALRRGPRRDSERRRARDRQSRASTSPAGSSAARAA